MTSYARLQRAAATLKRVRAGLDSLAAGASSEEERERLRRAAVQARVMYEGLERRLRRALEALEQEQRDLEGEAQHPAQATAESPGSGGTGGGVVAASGHGEPGEQHHGEAGGARPAGVSDGGVERAGAAMASRRSAARRRRAGDDTAPRGGQSGAR